MQRLLSSCKDLLGRRPEKTNSKRDSVASLTNTTAKNENRAATKEKNRVERAPVNQVPVQGLGKEFQPTSGTLMPSHLQPLAIKQYDHILPLSPPTTPKQSTTFRSASEVARTSPAEPYQPRYTTIIWDLGDVLFTWVPFPSDSLPPSTFRLVLRSHAFYEYECGRLSEDAFYAATAEKFDVPVEDVRTTFHGARKSLAPNGVMPALVRELKDQGIRVLAASNISEPDFTYLHAIDSFDWGLFEHVYTSYSLGTRKPDLGFFAAVIEHSGVDPRRTLFVDDKVENVLTARSFGLGGVVFRKGPEEIGRMVRAVCAEDPVKRGWTWCEAHKENMHSYTGAGKDVEENFTQILMYELTKREDLVNYVKYERLFHFYQGPNQPTIKEFPYDMDTTSTGLSICPHIEPANRISAMDEMLTFLNPDGIVQTYFDRTRPRIDPIVCLNVLSLFYMNNRGPDVEPRLRKTQEWCESVLETRAYLGGTTYYHCAEAFLYFFARLLRNAPPSFSSRWLGPFLTRLQERIGTDTDEACGLALRMLLSAEFDLAPGADLAKLYLLQDNDGGWPAGGFYRYPGNGVMIGNRGWTTMVALKAIEIFRQKGVQVDLEAYIA